MAMTGMFSTAETAHDDVAERFVGLEFDHTIHALRDEIVGIGERGRAVKAVIGQHNFDVPRRFRRRQNAITDELREDDIFRQVGETNGIGNPGQWGKRRPVLAATAGTPCHQSG